MKLDTSQIVDALIQSIEQNPAVGIGEREMARRAQRHPEWIGLRQQRMERVIHLLEAKGKSVLDAGCGNGLNAVLAVACGTQEVYAVEFVPEQYRLAATLFGLLDLSGRIHLITQDILQTELPPNSIDGAYSFEFMEHIADLDRYHRKIYAWLQRERRVYGRSGANGANPFVKRHFVRRYESQDREFYAPSRRDMIRQMIGEDISPGDLETLVRATRGLLAQEIQQTIDLWKRTGAMLPADAERPPRDPVCGAFDERLLYPQMLLHSLQSAGFDAKLLRPDYSAIFLESKWRQFVYLIAGIGLQIAHPASVILAPWLEVIGTKR